MADQYVCEECAITYEVRNHGNRVYRFCSRKCANLASAKRHIRNDDETALGLMLPNMRLAYHFANRWGPDLGDDGRQVAMVAVWKAAQQFDEGHGCRFSTFAVNKIKGAIMAEHDRRDKRPQHLSLEKMRESLGETVGVSFDYDLAPSVQLALSGLPNKERYIVEQVDLVGRSGHDVGRELGLSGTRINQIRREALASLRETLEEAA